MGSFWSRTVPLAVIACYRLVPERARCLVNAGSHGSSHLALAAVQAGGGWRALWHYALPRMHGGWLDWEHYR